MRHLLLTSACAFVTFYTFSQDGTDSLKNNSSSIAVSGKIIIANAGFAPVPAFSFNSPLVIGFLSLKKKKFSYDGDFALGLNGKPWMANNWFRFAFLDGKKIKTSIGINPSLFFKSHLITSGEEVIQAQRALTFEGMAERKFSIWSMRVTYMNIIAFDYGALSGNFMDVSFPISVIRKSKVIAINLTPQLFYFDFTGNTDGLFSSTSIRVLLQKILLSIYYQGVMPLWSAFPGNHFKWNIGLVYAF